MSLESKKFYLLFRLIGIGITIFSFYFIYKTVRNLHFDCSIFPNIIGLILVVVPCIIVFSILVIMMSFCWKVILEFVTKKKVSFTNVCGVYLMSNLGKYLPGNIFHFVGRNFLATKLNLKHSEIALTTILEIIFVGFLSFLLAFIFNIRTFFYFLLNNIIKNKAFFFILGIILFFLVIVILIFFLDKSKIKKSLLFSYINADVLLLFTRTSFFYIISNIITANILIFILFLFSKNFFSFNFSSFFNIQSIFFLSAFAGFVTPGSPGGIGVREGLLLFFLSKYFPAEVVAIAITLHRIISIFGDILAFFIGLIISRFEPKIDSPEIRKIEKMEK